MWGAPSAVPSMRRGADGLGADRILELDVDTPLPWVRVVRVLGELDRQTAAQLTTCVHAQLDGGAEHVVLDLSQLNELSLAGVSALIETREAASTVGSALHLAGICRPELLGPLQRHWQPDLFDTHRTIVEALAAISDGPGTGGIPLAEWAGTGLSRRWSGS